MFSRMRFRPLLLCPALLLGGPLALAMEVTPWSVTRSQGVVMQEEDLSCGAAAIAMVLQTLYQHEASEAEVLQAMQTKGIAANVNQMLRGIEAMGYDARALTLRFDELARLTVPVILFVRPPMSLIGMGHFVVLTRVTEDGVVYRDPSYGQRVLAVNDFRRYWETRGSTDLPGIAIAVLPRSTSQREASRRFTAAPIAAAAPFIPVR